MTTQLFNKSLNPFRSGQCLSTLEALDKLLGISVSIPFDQGNVFRQGVAMEIAKELYGLNPFRSGQCLSTLSLLVHLLVMVRLNPFRSGQCLSTDLGNTLYD